MSDADYICTEDDWQKPHLRREMTMPLRITVELVPYGIEEKSRPLLRMRVTNDGTGTSERGNYVVEAEGECSEGGESLGWDGFEDFPRRLEGIDRRRGYDYLASQAMQLLAEGREDG